MSSSTYKPYVHVGRVTQRHPGLLGVMKKLNEAVGSIQCLGVAALNVMMFIERDKKTGLIFFHSIYA